MEKASFFGLDSPWMPQAVKDRFEVFWGAYPRRNGRRLGKKAAFERFMALSETDQLQAIQAASQYARSLIPKPGEFVPAARDPERFLKQDFWRDYLEPETRPCQWRSGCDRIAGASGYCADHEQEKARYDRARELRGIQ